MCNFVRFLNLQVSTDEMEKIGDEIENLANLKSAVAAASHIKPHFNRKIRACA